MDGSAPDAVDAQRLAFGAGTLTIPAVVWWRSKELKEPWTEGAKPAVDVLKDSLGYYIGEAKKARAAYRVSETVLLAVAAMIPATAAFTADRRITAAFGVVVVVLTGLRAVFRWRENWLRFTAATARLITARELYWARARPYDVDSTRDVLLVERVREIEEAETGGWIELLSRREETDRLGVEGAKLG